MANKIEKFKKYLPYLDEVYMLNAKAAVLESDATLIKQGSSANEIVIPKMKMAGLGDYSRSKGYPKGGVELTTQTVTFNYDRGRQFIVDEMDNEETAGLFFSRLVANFVRTKIVPEQDAFRFATYSKLAGTKVSSILATGEDILTALQTATSTMDDTEVPRENRHLFITSKLLTAAQNVDTTKSRDILEVFTSIIIVPSSRFYTAIDLFDGETGGEEDGGFKKATTGKDINFLIIEKPAVMQFTKHKISKVIPPEDNHDADAWIFNFREYGLTDVYENKTAGVYLHHKA